MHYWRIRIKQRLIERRHKIKCVRIQFPKPVEHHQRLFAYDISEKKEYKKPLVCYRRLVIALIYFRQGLKKFSQFLTIPPILLKILRVKNPLGKGETLMTCRGQLPTLKSLKEWAKSLLLIFTSYFFFTLWLEQRPTIQIAGQKAS